MEDEKAKEIRMKQVFRRIMLLFIFQLSWLIGIVVAYSFISLGLPKMRILGFSITFGIICFLVFGLIVLLGKSILSKSAIFLPFSSKSLRITDFLYSPKIQKEIFEPIAADWQKEYFEALFKKEIWKAHWINVRYTYAFLAAMWQKSPIGDFVEFISKLAK